MCWKDAAGVEIENRQRSLDGSHPSRRLEPTLRLHANEKGIVGILRRALLGRRRRTVRIGGNDFRFVDCPCDGTERVAILALNLLKPLADVKHEGGEKASRMAFLRAA